MGQQLYCLIQYLYNTLQAVAFHTLYKAQSNLVMPLIFILQKPPTTNQGTHCIILTALET